MANLSGFDASQVPEQADFSAIPAGQYVVIATASEEKITKAGTGKYLQITFEVLDGPCKGRKLWARLNLWSPNETAKDIANRELGAICRAVGVIRPNDSTELHNKPMLVTVDTELDTNKNRENNVVKKYEPLNVGGQVAPTGQAPAMAPAPQGQAWNQATFAPQQTAAPAAVAQQPAPVTQAAPAGAAPWAR